MEQHAPSPRRRLEANLDSSPLASLAKTALSNFGPQVAVEGGDRLEQEFPLSKLKPSAKNPRRLSLDRAGVTPERIETLRKRQDESIDDWMNRQDQFLEDLKKRGDADNYTVWYDLFDLAVGLIPNGLIQPIVANMEGVIIAGERRYTALLLAGYENGPVLLKQLEETVQAIFRLLENLKRSDLSVAEICMSTRELMQMVTSEPAGPNNSQITVELIKKHMSAKQTQAYYYYTICQLDEADPMLARIAAGQFTSLRTAYEEVSQHLRNLRKQQVAGSLPPSSSEGGNTNTGSSAPAKKAAAPVVKLQLPGTESGKRFIKAMTNIEGLPQEATAALSSLAADWIKLNDKMRRAQLTDTINKVLESLSGLDADVDGETQ